MSYTIIDDSADCEDQGFSAIEDGCQVCVIGFAHGRAIHPKFIKERRYGTLFWKCPVCGGSFGEVE